MNDDVKRLIVGKKNVAVGDGGWLQFNPRVKPYGLRKKFWDANFAEKSKEWVDAELRALERNIDLNVENKEFSERCQSNVMTLLGASDDSMKTNFNQGQ